MDSTVAIQAKGFGFLFQAARNSLIAFSRFLTLPSAEVGRGSTPAERNLHSLSSY
jgi:hypothetical protein